MTRALRFPSFQLYVNDWRGSRDVARMTFAERGMFLEMLIEQWDRHLLPDNPASIAALIGGTVEEWTAAWPALRPKFVLRGGRRTKGDRRMYNAKLEGLRKERATFVQTARKGGQSRAKLATRSAGGTYLPADTPAAPPAGHQPAHQAPTRSSSSSSSSSSKDLDLANLQQQAAVHEVIGAYVDKHPARRRNYKFR
jgi:uncharacterized protein YdaU (DUF1376 family)